MRAAAADPDFAAIWSVFRTQAGKPKARLGTSGVDPAAREWLIGEQARLVEAVERAKAARIARDSVYALTLARA